MPDSPTVVPSAPALPPQNPVWGAIRAHLMGAAPDTESVIRVRALLTHLYPTPEERLRALHRLVSGSPAVFRTVATECGWSETTEPWLSFDLAVIAAVFADTDHEEVT